MVWGGAVSDGGAYPISVLHAARTASTGTDIGTLYFFVIVAARDDDLGLIVIVLSRTAIDPQSEYTSLADSSFAM